MELIGQSFMILAVTVDQKKKKKTRPDTRLLQSRLGGQGPYLRSLDYMGWSSEAKDRKEPKK